MHIGWLVLAIILSLIVGWLVGLRMRRQIAIEQNIHLPANYLQGLNFLLNEEQDKAVDVLIKMLEMDSSNVETHLVIGKLFRRRGEVDRAIRIHQNLIARPQLDKNFREQALFELGQDYLCAGVLDRAEHILLDLVSVKAYSALALQDLLQIYQKEKEWEKAIDTAAKLAIVTNKNMQSVIAHYHCELADHARVKGHLDQANTYLQQALEVDARCARASLLQAQLAIQQQDFVTALKYLKRIKNQNPDYLPEAIDIIAECYRQLNMSDKAIDYFMQIHEEYPCIPVVMILSELIQQQKGNKIAVNFVADYVRQYPSISGLHLFINLYAANAQGRAREDLLILQGLMQKLLSDKPNYQCHTCGFSAKLVHWQCPGCRQWDSVRPAWFVSQTAKIL